MATSLSGVNRVSSLLGRTVSIRTNEGTYTGTVSQSSDPLTKVVLSKDEFLTSDPQTAPKISSEQNVQNPGQNENQQRSNKREEENGDTRSHLAVHNPAAHNGLDVRTTRNLVNRSISFDNGRGSRITSRPGSYVVVDEFGEMFDEAVSMIRSCSVVGFGLDGVHLGRNGQLCWLHVATTDIVILFDMIKLNCKDAFDAGLRQIIESKSILKIMHDCRQGSDILQHTFGIRLIHVYDTQVADIMIYRRQNGGYMPRYVRNLAVVLAELVGLTREEVAFYHTRKSSLERNDAVWQQRPLSSALLLSAALNVRYLRELRMATLELLLADFLRGVDMYLDLVRTSVHGDSDAGNGQLLPEEFLNFGPMKEESTRRCILETRGRVHGNAIDAIKERYINSPVPPYDKHFFVDRSLQTQHGACHNTLQRNGADVGEDRVARRNPNASSLLQQQSIEPRNRQGSNQICPVESMNMFGRGTNEDMINSQRNTSNILFHPA